MHRALLLALALTACDAAPTSPDGPDASEPSPDAGSGVDDGGPAALPDATTPTDGGVTAPDAGPPGCATGILPGPDAPAVAVDGARAFDELAAAMRSGEWAQYETTAPEGYFRNTDGGHDLSWADTAIWDPTSQCILHYGGGHLTIPGFSVYCLRTNTWIRGTLPPWLDFEGSVWGYTNHGYDRNAFDPEARRLHFYRGRGLWTYDLACDQWERGELPEGNHTARDFAEWVPGLGVVHGRGENDSILFAYDPATDTQTRLGESLFHSQLHTFGAWSEARGALLYGGGDGNTSVYVMDRAGVSTRVTDSPAEIRTVSGGAAGGWVTVDPTNGDFLVLFVSGELHRYDPSADRWALESTSPLPAELSRTVSASLPEHGVILFATRTGGESARITLYKP